MDKNIDMPKVDVENASDTESEGGENSENFYILQYIFQ